jgi:sporulation protein YlmC with PRC-barrel domain
MRNETEALEMTHNASVGTQVVPEDIRDIRGTSIRGADDSRLGDVSDVIVDHETMQIRYLVVDSQGWLDSQTFLLPAERIAGDKKDDANLAANVTREQIEHAPRYDNEAAKSGTEWRKYQLAFQKYWDEEPVMHLKGSDRIITLPEETPSTQGNSAGPTSQPEDRELNAADLFPERMTPVFSDPAPGSGKVTLRPKSAARAEEAASGVSLLKPHWWESFENYLRLNKDDIQAKCPQCPSKAA